MHENKLGVMPIRPLLRKMAIPTILAQLVQLLYNVVDRIYVGRIPGEGVMALAGLGVTFPVILTVIAFAAFIGMGGGPRSALAMGKGNKEEAERYLGNSICLLIILSLVLTVFLSFFKNPILVAFGASESILPYASSYLSIYLLGTVFVQFALGLNSFVTNQGFSHISMIAIALGCGLNIILDPIFIFTLEMGVEGAAVATVISQAVSALFILGFLLSRHSLLKIRIKNLQLSKVIVGGILSLGVSTFVMQITEALVLLVFNKGMLLYGDDRYIALMSIFFSLIQLVFLPIIGMGQGAQPILSYNYGAKKMDRVKECFKYLFISSTAFSTAMIAVILIFPQVFIGLFTSDASLIELGKTPLRVFLFGMSFMGIQISCQQAFVSFGMAKISAFFAIFRKLVLMVPLALLLPKIPIGEGLLLGVWGLFLAESISDVVSAMTAGITFKVRLM